MLAAFLSDGAVSAYLSLERFNPIPHETSR